MGRGLWVFDKTTRFWVGLGFWGALPVPFLCFMGKMTSLLLGKWSILYSYKVNSMPREKTAGD
jgi:hypothetical protein